eukprot:TRINITY_DN3178_c0_g1::TRINITY_DN3178_c0_g1_i1::g.3566::m.3566 TRINITY_DN3178_c0_g1::TRINITY_DN3178_c0_g1_i1::g.3566  ORF type:complete len:276 (-),score=62.20,sp/Q55BD5/CSN7_DICDI/46.59/4e-52,PCI/PF01399.22/2e-10,Flg_hook/PF02120.11/0.022,RP-C_C/PF11800.3/0.13 TRINITY_DN3178_c0_g1_i1:205-1032(-)
MSIRGGADFVQQQQDALDGLCILAKSAKGKACAHLIMEVISHPLVHVFSELLENPNIQALNGTENESYLRLLKIFAYGTYQDYKMHRESLPAITDDQVRKLQRLSLITLASQSKMLPYPVLQQALEIAELRALEDLIIEMVYMGLIAGKLDQKKQQLEVHHAIGRDLVPEQLDRVLAILSEWCTDADQLLLSMQHQAQFASNVVTDSKKMKEQLDSQIENIKTRLKDGNLPDEEMEMHFSGGAGASDRASSSRRPKPSFARSVVQKAASSLRWHT